MADDSGKVVKRNYEGIVNGETICGDNSRVNAIKRFTRRNFSSPKRSALRLIISICNDVEWFLTLNSERFFHKSLNVACQQLKFLCDASIINTLLMCHNAGGG